MNKKDYLKMLNNIEQGEEPTKPGQHERVVFIDGLNLFLRNLAILNFVNSFLKTWLYKKEFFLYSEGNFLKKDINSASQRGKRCSNPKYS